MSRALALALAPPRRRQRPEQTLQAAVAKFLRHALGPETWWGAIPLGGGGRVRGGVLQRTGTRAGTPDLEIIYKGRVVWLELKAPKGRLSDNQLYTHRQLRNAGSPVYVCRSLDDVMVALRLSGIPLRGRLVA
jgi:hypothetical protein